MSLPHLSSTITIPNLHLSQMIAPAVAVGALGVYGMTKHEFGKAEQHAIDVMNGNDYTVIGRTDDGKEIRKYDTASDAKATISSAITGIGLAGLGGIVFSKAKTVGSVEKLAGMAKSQALGGVGALMIGIGIGVVAGSVAARTVYANTELHRSV